MASQLFGRQAAALRCNSEVGLVSPRSHGTQCNLLGSEASRAGFSTARSKNMMAVPKCLGLTSLLSIVEVRAMSTCCASRARIASRKAVCGSKLMGIEGSTMGFQLRGTQRKGGMVGAKRVMLVVRGSSQHDGTKPFDRSELEEMLHLNDDVGSESSHHKKTVGISSERSELEEILHLGDDVDSGTLHHGNSGTPSPSPVAGSSPPYVKARNKSLRNGYKIEEGIERTIFNFRFLTLFGVIGSLLGAVLCFVKGCSFVWYSYREYYRAFFGVGHTSRVILYLVEAVDVYLMGTVMLIFGMGLYELFVSALSVGGVPGFRNSPDGVVRSTVYGSSLFGIFRLTDRPRWLEIRSLDELKTKLGHVIVMILFVGMFEKSKRVVVHTAVDFLCFSGSILLSAGALFLLSRLHGQTLKANWSSFVYTPSSKSYQKTKTAPFKKNTWSSLLQPFSVLLPSNK